MNKYALRLIAVLMIASLMMVAFASLVFAKEPWAAEDQETTTVAQESSGPAAVQAATDAAMDKMHPALREPALAGGAEQIMVSVWVEEGTDLSAYLDHMIVMRSFDGEQGVYGVAQASALSKIAATEGVNVLLPVGLQQEAPPSPDPDVQPEPASPEAARARLQAAQAGELSAPLRNPTSPSDWNDVMNVHQAQDAWAKGYRGEGVWVAVLDDSVDFAHPDLIGTWAVYPEVHDTIAMTYTLRYGGWPVAFSPASLIDYVYESNFAAYGYTDVSDGNTWYAATTYTATVASGPVTATVAFAPLGATEAHTYTFNNTSQSGVYHLGSHPDDNLQALLGDGERAAVLVVDENTAGVYDTVYADIDFDMDFTDEMPMTKASPASYQDIDGDGYADISGGMIYFIGDGVTNIPVADVLYLPQYNIPPGNGDLVAFHGALDLFQAHGTRCASNVVGQGVINGGAPVFRDFPGGTGSVPYGMVWGGAPDAGLVGVSNVYDDFDNSRISAYIFSVYGYDSVAGSGDEVQITTNSYGESGVDNDGWEYYGRYVSRRQRLYTPSTSFLFSTGNGAPGYGTVAPPSQADTIVGIGASTHMGSTGWDSIIDTDQIMYNDMATWSNRGPGASGDVGVHVAADGAYAAGDVPLNQFGFDGWNAWATWGGTSRSAPVAGGIMALLYEAYKENHGDWPTYDVARAILMASSNDTDNDVFVQGAGTVNADRATDVAAGLYGVYTMPDVWRVGDYRGEEMGGFANIIAAGEDDTQTFTVYNDSAAAIEVSLADDLLLRTDSYTFTFTSELTATEWYTPGDAYYFDAPNYLMDLSDIVPDMDLMDADMMNVRLWFSYDQFDLDGSPGNGSDNLWRLLVYNWKDINNDGDLWTDDDGDGVVDFMPLPADESGDEIEPGGELDAQEYGRFAYLHNNANNLEVRVKQPYSRRHDGIFIGLQHTSVDAAVPTSTVHFQIDLYQHSDWEWVELS
ncbi:MAG: S8 family serine peptidase, partial [Anaerolineae bacterium]